MVKLNLNLTKKQKNVTKGVITRVPRSEEEVKRIFYKLENVLGFTDVRLYTSFPDATAFYEGKEIEIGLKHILQISKSTVIKKKTVTLSYVGKMTTTR